MNTYKFSFRKSRSDKSIITWTRLGQDMYTAFALAKAAALHDYPAASGFLIMAAEVAP